MKRYILFGAGAYAQKAIGLLGKENTRMILDNDKAKWGTYMEDILITNPDAIKDEGEYSVIVSVSQKYQAQIAEQLRRLGVGEFRTIQELQTEKTYEKIRRRQDYIGIYNKAIQWIGKNTLDGQMIICNTNKRKGYPEVTGYYIPTLLRWGYRELALSYAKWLCAIQKQDGSWYDTDDRAPYIFDTAQILKGLIAIREIYPQADSHIIKGCDWVIGNMCPSGRLATPSTEAWGDGKACSELIHLYCLSPLAQAADALNMPQYREAARKILNYYKRENIAEIMNFGLLSHFYAYVMEGLLDMGERDMVSEAMDKVSQLQKENGAVPAYHNVDWVCSTGLFQFALVWYRLGDTERGNKAFAYACKLQNESGGWYGSYLSEDNSEEDNDYFPDSEISWAVKYFLDALYYKNITEFDLWADSFLTEIDKNDGRYKIVRNVISENRKEEKKSMNILDVGCGKGRYLKNLLTDYPEERYYAVDLSESVLRYIEEEGIVKKQGSLTSIDYADDFFDVVYTCEALEHAVDIESAVREMARVTRDGGKIVIIDKNRAELGRMEIVEWEVWFDAEELRAILSNYCSKVEVIEEIDYEQKSGDKLFLAWVGTVKKRNQAENY